MKTGKILLKQGENVKEVGFCFINESPESVSRWRFMLHPREIAHYLLLKNKHRRDSYQLGRISSKFALSELYGKERIDEVFIDYGIFKFSVIRANWIFNTQLTISHTGNLGIAIAFPEDHPLGVDVEMINSENESALIDQMTQDELKIIKHSQLPMISGITALWSVKESLSKILRLGMTINFKILEVDSLRFDGRIITGTFSNFQQYEAIVCISHNYVCSLVLPKKTTADLDGFFSSFLKLTERTPGSH